jgi:hypothetical protein
MENHLLVVIVLVLAASFFLGTGITGLVISQSCCFGAECPAEYLCDAAEPILESPGPVRSSAAGAILLLAAVLYGYVALRRQ